MFKELMQNENHASPNSDGYFKGYEIAQTQPNRPWLTHLWENRHINGMK